MSAKHLPPPEIRPLASQKSLRINWRAFEYYAPLKKLLQHVSEHPGENLSMSEAACIASLCYTYFAEYFHRKTGVTFKYWIDFVRVEHAARLLETSDKSVADVAQESGFCDGTTLARTFRRLTGRTPTQFRRAWAPRPYLVRQTDQEAEDLMKESEESPRH